MKNWTLISPTGKSIELSDTEMDAIYDSMEEYGYNGEEESDIATDIQNKIASASQ